MAEWQIKRGESQFAAPDLETLEAWARTGNVVQTDYVFNPILQQWMYAKDLGELQAVFGKPESAGRERQPESNELGARLSRHSRLLLFQAGWNRAPNHRGRDVSFLPCEEMTETVVKSSGYTTRRARSNGSRNQPNLAVERTSASSSAIYSDGLRGWPKPLALKR